MPRTALTGTRIRARRTASGMRQADLARLVGVSPSYLNLIEHNRRNVGDDLLEKLAKVMGIAPEALLEGGEGEVMEAVRSAAAWAGGRGGDDASQPLQVPELERVEEFLGRFPGWAWVLAGMQRRVEELERVVEQLSDRMTHDPYLPAALHEIVSAVTSVQSTAAILADGDDVDPEWQRKFHANILADSARLADGAEALVSYLDASNARETGLAAPQEEIESWLAGRGWHVAELEAPGPLDLEALVDAQIEIASDAARSLALRWLRRFRADAQALPLGPFTEALADAGPDPERLAARFGAPLDRVFRRLAMLPTVTGTPQPGLVLCDGSGTLTFRRPVEGFALPRFGGACPLWPLYQAMLRPSLPIRTELITAARVAQRFDAFAFASVVGPARFDMPPVIEAAMLLVPASLRAPDAARDRPVLHVGPSCRICPEPRCMARREPSILARGGQGPETGDDPGAWEPGESGLRF